MVEDAYNLGETLSSTENRDFSFSSLSTLEQEECLAQQSTDLHTFFFNVAQGGSSVHDVHGRRFMMFSGSDTSFPCKFLETSSMLSWAFPSRA